MLRIKSLEVDDHILDKIEVKHGITFAEVEEACLSDKRHVRRGKEGLYKLFSQTTADTIYPGGAGKRGERQLEDSHRQGDDR